MSIIDHLTDKQKHDQWMKGLEAEAEKGLLRSTAFVIASAFISIALFLSGGSLMTAGYAIIGAAGGLLVHWAGRRDKQKGPRHPEG